MKVNEITFKQWLFGARILNVSMSEANRLYESDVLTRDEVRAFLGKGPYPLSYKATQNKSKEKV